ncbi:MAG: XTP/dITP diphosphatase [Ruminococcaceae bacterium]|nr:XTP/dITP diphosphatase [Oscillospiraceae bacterium]
MKLVLASHNKHKIKEIEAVLLRCGITDIELLSLTDVGYEGDIEENGTTFEENAVIKASVPAALGYCGIADDSGLEVDALEGRPGVYSARFAGEPCNDENNNKKLLRELDAVPDGERTARFVSVVAFVDPNHPERNFTVRGECPGTILREERGHDGFGYDPLFYLPELDKTYAQITTEEKNAVSHRGKAMRLFAERYREMSHD